MTIFKKILNCITVITILGICQWAYAGPSEEAFVAGVKSDQHRQVMKLMKQFLHEASPQVLENEVLELARLDSLMSLTSGNGNDFILGTLPRGIEPCMIPVALLYRHINENGGPRMDLAVFFQGRSFQYYARSFSQPLNVEMTGSQF